ncbi:MAG: hypothetical protein MR506_04100 [Dialister sp.]|nr:hypothetical protein [Dialister sp.]MCI7319310.1 hypothetical protein [Dialister sp.]
MKKLAVYYDNPKQGILPAFFSECLDITDPVFTFDRCMEEIDLRKYLSKLPAYELGRIRYNPVNVLKTVLFGFMDEIIKGLDKFSKTRFSRRISPTQKRQEAYPIEWSDPMNRAPGWEA